MEIQFIVGACKWFQETSNDHYDGLVDYSSIPTKLINYHCVGNHAGMYTVASIQIQKSMVQGSDEK
jgi:hypothetical protein